MQFMIFGTINVLDTFIEVKKWIKRDQKYHNIVLDHR